MGSGVSRQLKKHSKICETTWRESNDGTGNYRDQMTQIYESLHSFDKQPFKERQEYRTKAGDELVAKNCVRIICQNLSDALSGKVSSSGVPKVFLHTRQKKGKNVEKEEKSVLEMAMESIVLVTDPDCSAKACDEVLSHPTFLHALLTCLENITKKTTKWNFDEEVIFREGLSVLHNLAVYLAECSDAYEGSVNIDDKIATSNLNRMVKIITDLRDVDDKESKLLSVTALACLNEAAMKYVHTQFMCLNLSLAFDERDHRSLRCSATAMERGIRHLLTVREAQSEEVEDKDKSIKTQAKTMDFTKNLVECGVLRLLIKGVKSEVWQERRACMESLWILCCSTKECRKDMAGDEAFLNLLVELYENLSNRTLQELAELMLLNLYRHHDMNWKKKPKNLHYGHEGKFVDVKKSGTERGIGHVMISYQWESKDIVMKVKEYLEKQDIKIWIDEEKMSDEGDINDAMASAVEESAVFLMGVSAKYFKSKNCKKEANYAEVCDKPIFPLLLQKDFKPKGWLGVIQGNKYFFEFTPNDQKQHEENLKKLASAIKKYLKVTEQKAGSKDSSVGTGTAGPDEQGKVKRNPSLRKIPAKSPRELLWVTPYCRLNPYAACSSRQDGFAHCCCVTTDPKKEVREWAKKFKLEGKEINSLTKKDLETLIHLQEQSPEFFYKRIWKDLKMKKVSDVLHFESALKYWQKKEDKKIDEKKAEQQKEKEEKEHENTKGEN